MLEWGPFIVKWREKGPFKALGLHHAAPTVASVLVVGYLPLWLSGNVYVAIAGASFAWGAWSCWYFFKEHRENGHKFEIFDSLSPLLFGGLAVWALIIERLI
jgi:membrane associated rhomboid family serine protease